MKTFIIAAIAICYSFTARAQNTELFKKKPWEEYKLKSQLRDSLKFILPVPPAKKNLIGKDIAGVAKLTLKGTFLAKNSNGDEIYSMQPDNMPCLVPDKKLAYNMTVAGLQKGNEVKILPLLQNNENTGKNADGVKDKK